MRVRASYSGRVQGVGFRATTRDLAGAFRVSGWVRNEADGTVTLEAQGEAAEVEAFLGAIARRLGRFITTTGRLEVAESAGATGFAIQR